ncbi:major facilitator superfamily (MFS) transporter [Candidatus Koribacter versatilis Ellin345]|uniref:Major facilitator superfamily (MFS) transporter n=1 Tax=Koribacter versatilis (strain Ellin345) TaxID=204669 RepID=Q1IRJ8_KORVE|nr:MFS transporter [Candidatus Koribacter versatilis]ABF40502.1 major facilitator superfamily (MFS) transporter [Candidatus Koribacter versatilis Ellin345]
MDKPRRNFWQIVNMSVGFLGIQFGWNLQMANMSAIYEYLGARADQIPILWLAAPLTGLIVQPLIGHASDHTWGKLGRRRPYFLTGAILSSLALILMPRSGALWMAAGLLWILDASINISMEPFRAFVADILPEEQRTRGFAMQSLMIGLGAVMANVLPYLLLKFGNLKADTTGYAIPLAVRISFYVGAAAFFGAVMWTILTTKEYPPDDLEAFRKKKEKKGGLGLGEIVNAVREMPMTMRQLAPVQFLTWLGLFCMWLFFGVAVARNVLGATDAKSKLYTDGIAWGGICFAFYSGVTFVYSFFLPAIAKAVGRRRAHSLSLLCGAAGLISVAFIHDKNFLLLSMVGVGIAWASTLAMPYSILAASLPPERTGVYMGIFNFFIVTPEIIASLVFGWVMVHWLNNNRLYAVIAGGVFMIAAAIMMQFVTDPAEKKVRATEPEAVVASRRG